MELMQQIFTDVARAYGSALLMNGTSIILAYLLVWQIFKKPLQRWRIQLKQRADFEQIKEEIKNALLVFLVGALSAGTVLYLNRWGYSKIYTDFSAQSLWWNVGCFFVMWLIDDTWFYWMHRLLHAKQLYRHVHQVHHYSIDVTPFTSMSFHVLEAFLLSAWFFPAALLMPIYAPALGVLQLFGLFNNIKSHLGYELYPAWVNNGPLRFLVTSTHHNMHHSKFQGNYGLHFRFWDWLCDTEFKDYSDTFAEVKARKLEVA